LPEIVQEIGAYAGLASVLGLAVLSALYFSQARDVKRLREWAGRAPERGAGVPGQPQPQRVVAQPQRPGQPRPGAPAVPGQQRPAPLVPGQPRPGAQPVPGQPRPGVQPAPGQQRPGAPSLPAAASASGARPAAATPAAQGPNSAAAQGATDQPATQPQPSGAEGQAPGGAGAPKPPGSAPGAPAPTGPATPLSEQARAATPTQVLPTAGKPSTPAAQRPVVGQRPGVGGPAAGARPPGLTPMTPPPHEPWYRTPRTLVVALVGLLVVGGAVAFGLTQLGGDDSPADKGPDRGAARDDGSDRSARRAAPIDPADITVSVLNGTTVPGLARQVGDEAVAQGFKVGNVDNSPDSDQQRAESVIQFAEGHRRDAMAVGRRLGIAQRELIDAEVQQLAGDASVVV
jgi:hypothetical protein